MDKTLTVIGYVSGIAANNADCRLGPEVIWKAELLRQSRVALDWQSMLVGIQGLSKSGALTEVANLNTILAQQTQQLTKHNSNFLILGGDHSCAIGTWSGAASALRPQGPLGLIWIDAHMDSHTPQTTQSGNIHGMPLASLLGQGYPELTNILDTSPKLLPQHVCLIGVRSFEKGEADLLQRLNVRIYFMEEVKQRGLAVIFKEAIQIVTKGTAGYGISFDLDAIDPPDAPGVSMGEKDGLKGKEFCHELAVFKNDAQLLGLEIVEFNPKKDKKHKTKLLIIDTIASVFGP